MKVLNFENKSWFDWGKFDEIVKELKEESPQICQFAIIVIEPLKDGKNVANYNVKNATHLMLSTFEMIKSEILKGVWEGD